MQEFFHALSLANEVKVPLHVPESFERYTELGGSTTTPKKMDVDSRKIVEEKFFFAKHDISYLQAFVYFCRSNLDYRISIVRSSYNFFRIIHSGQKWMYSTGTPT